MNPRHRFAVMVGRKAAVAVVALMYVGGGRWEVRGEEDDVVLAEAKTHIGINRKCARYSE